MCELRSGMAQVRVVCYLPVACGLYLAFMRCDWHPSCLPVASATSGFHTADTQGAFPLLCQQNLATQGPSQVWAQVTLGQQADRKLIFVCPP